MPHGSRPYSRFLEGSNLALAHAVRAHLPQSLHLFDGTAAVRTIAVSMRSAALGFRMEGIVHSQSRLHPANLSRYPKAATAR
jgi:hypothetical protein